MVVIGLDAGHGLKTSGKRTPDGIHEWELNDKVRDYVVKLLKGYDVKFIFTDNNEGVKDETLSSRKKTYVNNNCDAFVSIHHNAHLGKWGSANGVEIYVDRNNTSDDMKLAKAIYKNLPKYTGLKSRGIKKVNWTVIYQNKVPAVLVEGGFMDNKKDHKVITSDEGQLAYAKAVAEGLISFLGLKKANKTDNDEDNNSFLIRVLAKELNIRSNAGAEYEKVGSIKDMGLYTIVDTKKAKDGGTWGKLKSDAGWINISPKYVDRI